MVFQPVSAAADRAAIMGENRGGQVQLDDALALAGTVVAATAVALPFISHAGTTNAPESIAMAKLTGTADRNGQPLLNGSIVSSGDFLSTHGDSALLLTSAPQERLWLGPNTSAKLSKDAGNVTVALQHGTLGFQTRGHIQVTFEDHDGLAIRSRPDSAVLAQLSLVNSQEAEVRLQEGSLELVKGNHSVLLQPEKSGSVPRINTGSSAVPPTKRNLSAAARSASQSDTGSIAGSVVDKDLFVVSGANVTLTSATGKVLTTLSNQEGKFAFSDVTPGNYTLHVGRAGLPNYELPNVIVRAGNESSLYVQLGGRGGNSGGSRSGSYVVWILVGGVAAGVIGGYLANRGSSSISPSTTQ